MNSVTSAQADQLIKDQLAVWPQAADNFAALANVKVKQLDVDGMNIKIQFNPARIVSSSAKVDAKSLKERKCFLCEANRPAVQTGLTWGMDGKYTVLINPFPIFPRHLTIPDNSHVDQLIVDRVEDMFRLAEDLDEYTVFYNGPKCGASAPDHMHFQAGNSDFLTIAETLENAELKSLIVEDEAVLSVVDTLPMKMFVLDATDYVGAVAMFRRMYDALPVPEGEREPMMNVLCYTTAAGMRMVIIPRKQHRPSFYGTEGPDTMLLSPASVDMGGVFITPLEKDFDKIDADIVRRIFDELCLSKEEIDAVAERIIQ
jgi:ATP adenylyltransferase/5',5'''-P-1,P-4-tetraphosphate phosphorylase II